MTKHHSLATRGASLLATALMVATLLPAPVAASVTQTSTTTSGTAAPAATVVLGPNLVTNGSFELPALTADSTSPTKLTSAGAIPGWTLTGTVNLVRCAVTASCPTMGYPWAAQDGAQSVDLEGTTVGSVTQSIPTTPGHTYTLTFWYMPGPLQNDPDQPYTAVKWNGTKLRMTFADPNGGPRKWLLMTATGLVATGSSTVLSFVGNAEERHGFGLDTVSLQDENPVPATPPATVIPAPQLLAAAPTDNGLGSQFAGRILAPAGSYQVTFYAAGSCAGIGFGTPALGTSTVTTPVASGIFTAQLPTTPIAALTPFVAAKITGPASTPGVAGVVSDFGGCVVFSPQNDSWPRALDITPSGGTQSHPTLGDWIDQAGGGRWFKVHVVPGGSVTVDLSGLSADYDVYLFRDIAQTYNAITTSTDLTALSAQFAGSGFSGSGFSGSGFSGSGFSGSGFSGSGFSGSGFSGSGFSGSGFSADSYSGSGFSGSGFSGSGFSGSGFSGSGFSGSGFSGSGFSGSGFSGSGFSPASFSAAQTYSLIGWSNNLGLSNEHVTANTWTSTGDFYIRVNGKNGAFSLDAPFNLTVTETSSLCTGVSDIGTKPLAPLNTAETVILTDSSRFGGADTTAMLASLNTLASTHNGVLVDLAGDTRIQALQYQADNNTGCVYAENLVASAAKDIVDAYRASNTAGGIKYVVLAGNDSIVPYFRYPDTSSIGPEVNFYPPVAFGTASEASLRSNYVLGQDAYGSSHTMTVNGIDFPIPDLAVGRLVETPAEIAHMVQVFLHQPTVVPTSSMVSGYDFVADSAAAVEANLVAGTGHAAPDSLITLYGVAPTDPTSWSAADLKGKWLGSRHDISYIAGHFSASAALAADFNSVVTTADMAAANAAGVDFTNSIVFSVGCHSGYNVVDGAGIAGVTDTLDWSQEFARQGITSITGTGYQYGDSDFIAYSERIYTEFSHQLLMGSGPVAIGDALVASKTEYLKQTFQLGDLHTKALLESALYGLPMLAVNMPAGRIQPPSATAGLVTSPFGTAPGSTTGLRWADFSKDTSGSVRNHKLLNVAGGTTLDAIWYTAPDGSVQTEPGAPAIPLYSDKVTPDVAPSGYVLRGVGFRSGTYTDSTVVPLTGAPGTELQTSHTSFDSPTFYPSQMFKANYFDALTGGADTTLLMTPAQHMAPTPGDPYITLRLYGNVGVRLFYSNSTAAGSTSGAPVVYGVGSTHLGNGDTRIAANVVGDPNADIQQVWVTYTAPHSGVWQSFDLTRDGADPTLWAGTATLPDGTFYMVQAVNGFGLVTNNNNLGAYFLAGSAVAAASTSALAVSAGASGTYGTTTPITATLASGGTPVPGKLVIVSLGGTTRSGTTDANGQVVVSMPLASAAGTYSIEAQFLGDATTLASGGSRPFDILPATSSVLVTCPVPVTFTGAAQTPCSAALTGAGGLQDVLPVTYSNNVGAGTATASASYPGDAAHTGSDMSVTFSIGAATPSVAVVCTPNVTYTGSPIEPCHASVSGAGGLTGSVEVTYPTDHTSAGTINVTATFPADANHTTATGTGSFIIDPASSTVTVTCPDSVVFTGSAQSPCTAAASGAGMTDVSLTVHYTGNTDTSAPGTAAGASASWPGDANHTGNSWSATFVIGQATSKTVVSCPTNITYTGAGLEPCTAVVTGAGDFNQTLTVAYSDNVNVGTAHATASYSGDANHSPSNDAGTFTIDPASTTTVLHCTANVTFNGSEQTPCTATVTGDGTGIGAADLTYSANINAGPVTVSADYPGDANHLGSHDASSFTIDRAPSSVTVTCPTSARTYTGSALTPCTANVAGDGGLNQSVGVNYTHNTDAGPASASATYAGDPNHLGDTGLGSFGIDPAPSTTVVTCPASVVFDGTAQAPCSANVTGAGGLNQPVSPVAHSNNTNVGPAGASATYAGDSNHASSTGTGSFAITAAPSSTVVACPDSNLYTGAAITPCWATVTGIGGLSTTVDVTYVGNTIIAGNVTANASFGGDANHAGSSGTWTFTISPALSVATIHCPASLPYTGLPLTPCTAAVTSVGVNQSLTPTYVNNTAVGTQASATASYAGDANHAATSASTTFEITVATPTVAMAVSTLSGNATPQYSDSVLLTATLPVGAAGTVQFTINGNSSPAIAVVAGSASWQVQLGSAVIPAGAGSYGASAAFTPVSGSPYAAATSATINVAVAREGQLAGGIADGSSRTDYTGSQITAVGAAPTLSARILQGLSPNSSDTEKVDFSKVSVPATIAVYPAACGTTCPTAASFTSTLTIANASDWATTGAGTVSVAGPKTLAQGAYLVVVTVGTNPFIAPQVAEAALTIGSVGSTSFVGGGSVATDSTANAPVKSGLFAYAVKSGTPPTGGVLYIYRLRIDVSTSTATWLVPCAVLGATCRDVDVIVRSSALTTLTLGKSGSSVITAAVIGKATVLFVDAADGTTHYAALESTGADVRLDALDSLSGASYDKFGLTVYRGGSVFHQAYVPGTGAISQTSTAVATNQVVLGSGSIALH